MGGVWSVARAEARARTRALLALVLLVAVGSGVVLTTAAGARRTSTSFERLADATLARDAKVQVDDPELVDPVFAALEALPAVTVSGRSSQFPVYVDPSQVDSVEFDFAIAAPEDGRWAKDVDRGLLLSGRRPDREAANEIALNEAAEQQFGLGPGDSLEVVAFTPEDLDALFSGGAFPGFNGPSITLEVVGVLRQADELLGSVAQAAPTGIASPAFYETYGEQMGGFTGLFALRLADPEHDLDQLQAVLRETAGAGAEVEAIGADEEFAASAQSAIDVLANALWIVTLVAALTAAVAIGGALRRQLDVQAGVAPTLSAIGLARWQRSIALGAPVAGALVAGVVLGAAASVGASTLLPIGLAGRAEPSPGVDVDPVVLLLGSLALVAAGCAWLALVSVGMTDRARGADRVPSAPRTGFAFWLGPAAGLGVREGMLRRRAVGTGALGVALGVVGVVGVATVLTSLDGLVSHPARYGWAWSSEPDALDSIDGAVDSLDGEGRVAAVGVIHAVRVELGGRQLQGISLDVVRGELGVPIIDGRAPTSKDEIAIGERTAEGIGATIGDEVEVRTSAGDSTVRLRVVGTAVFRPVDNPDPGDGVLLTSEGLARVARSDGFDSLVLRYPDDVDTARLEDALAADHPLEFSVYAHQRLPGNLANLQRTDGLLRWLGGFFVVVGLAAAGHALLVSVARRRRDLSTLRALGFRRAQIRATVRWQALTLVVIGVVVGAPLGIAAGRSVWLITVGDYGVVDDPTNAVAALLLLVPAAVGAAWLLSMWPARRAVSQPLGQALRSE